MILGKVSSGSSDRMEFLFHGESERTYWMEMSGRNGADRIATNATGKSMVSILAEGRRRNRYGHAGCQDSVRPATSETKGSAPGRIW